MVLTWGELFKIEVIILSLWVCKNTMACFHKAPPQRFEAMGNPMYYYAPNFIFQLAVIKEFNKPNRKPVISWFVMNYVGDLSYVFHGRRITTIHKNLGTPYFETQKFLPGSHTFRILNLSR